MTPGQYDSRLGGKRAKPIQRRCCGINCTNIIRGDNKFLCEVCSDRAEREESDTPEFSNYQE